MSRRAHELDPHARAGRAGRMTVANARSHRAEVRYRVGRVSRDDLPTTEDILKAALHLSALLRDATEGDARLLVSFNADGSSMPPAVVLQELA